MKFVYLKSKHGSFAKLRLENGEVLIPVFTISIGPNSQTVQAITSKDHAWSNRSIANAGFKACDKDEFDNALIQTIALISEKNKE